MRSSFSTIASIAFLLTPRAGATQAAELPLLRELQRQLGFPGGAVLVYEPYLNVGR